MLSVFDRAEPRTRREVIRCGALGAAGLTLADVLRARAAEPARRPKSVIVVYLLGGPSHIDMYDMKPDAPAEYRGEFKPVRTTVPGLEVCELMPQQAKIAKHLAIVNGIENHSSHNVYEHLSGSRPVSDSTIGPSPRPALGSVVSRLRGRPADPLPHYVSLGDTRLLGPAYEEFETPAYLGAAHAPFRSSGPGMENLRLAKGVALDQLGDRRQLLRAFDRGAAAADATRGLDGLQQKALDLLGSSKVRDAFDLSRESPRVRDSYGGYDEFLLARRLVEAGVSVVTLPARFHVKIPNLNDPGGWDTHGHHFKFMKEKLPRYDRAVSALIVDLEQRGLLDDTAVVVWGEFGRQPRIGDVTPDGRGHWPQASSALLAGGGLKTGQVIGRTDRLAERPTGRPFTPANVLATLYTVLGIDMSQTFPDHSGRPQFVLDDREPIAGLL